jgi:hypothetical protein
MRPKISGLTFNQGTPRRDGSRVLCYFDAEIAGLRLHGCALAVSPRNGLVVWGPRSEIGPRRGVSIIDDGLRSRFMDAACEAFRALGGVIPPDVARATGRDGLAPAGRAVAAPVATPDADAAEGR